METDHVTGQLFGACCTDHIRSVCGLGHRLGVAVTGHLKPALIAIANAVEKMTLPIDPNFEKATNTDSKLIIQNTPSIYAATLHNEP